MAPPSTPTTYPVTIGLSITNRYLWWCIQLVEHVFFNKGPDDFFVQFDGTWEADCFTGETLYSGAQRQIVSFNALSEDFAGQMLIFRHFSGITAPVIAGYHANTERSQQRQQLPTSFICTGTEGVGQYTACFGVVCVPEPYCQALLPTKPRSSQMSATSAWVTGEDVIRFGASFLKCG